MTQSPHYFKAAAWITGLNVNNLFLSWRQEVHAATMVQWYIPSPPETIVSKALPLAGENFHHNPIVTVQ